MNNNAKAQNYTIKEVATLCGLPESTLRYYETIGLIHSIHRDVSSKHRLYTKEDVTFAEIVACLNATGMSIEDMKGYFANRSRGAQAADEQIELLEKHKKRLANEERYIKLRQKYVDNKIAYWKAIKVGDEKQSKTIKDSASSFGKELQLLRIMNKNNL